MRIDTNRRGRDPVASREHTISANFNKWWLLPFGIFTVSALIALNILVTFGPLFTQQTGSNMPIDCSGPKANDFSCYQMRYENLVYNSGVEAAFADLKDEFAKEKFVQASCHELTHGIGRAAAELYGDVASTYSRGDDFCGSGYYHGALETIVANIGADNILDEADNICADPREQQNQSLNHRNCAHGLGHGFMGLYQNEVFESLEACDALSDEWEREQCSGGVFMENVIDEDNPSNPSKYLKADQPFYPCTEVKTEYKSPCYARQTNYVLKKQGEDFAKVFDLCGKVEEDFREICYVGLGNNAVIRSTRDDTAEGDQADEAQADEGSRADEGAQADDGAQTEFIHGVCMLGQTTEAQSKCLVGAVRQLIFFYDGDVQAKALCESIMRADWRAGCLQLSEEAMAQRRVADGGTDT
jgi:hypothetical protein